MRWLKRLLVVAIVLYCVGLAAVYFGQRSFIYFPDTTETTEQFADKFGARLVDVPVENIGEIKSVFLDPGNEAPIILFFHGNGGSVHHRTAQLTDFRDWGVGFLAAEYPGYSSNPGLHSEVNFFRSALAHYDWLIAAGVAPERVVIYGNSLGSASAVHVASERSGAGLVLTAPFFSATAMARRRMPIFPTNLLLKDKFRSDLKMARVNEPLLVLHGENDQVVPHEMGKALEKLHNGPSQFVSIPGAQHYMWAPPMTAYLRGAVFEFTALEE